MEHVKTTPFSLSGMCETTEQKILFRVKTSWRSYLEKFEVQIRRSLKISPPLKEQRLKEPRLMKLV